MSRPREAETTETGGRWPAEGIVAAHRGDDTAPRLSPADPERGSSSVLAIGVVLALVTVLLSALVLVAVLVAGQRARAAADLASLAAAGVSVEGGDQQEACAMAAQVAEDNGARLSGCAVVPGDGPWPDVRVTTVCQVAGTVWDTSAEAVAGGRPLRRG